MRGHVWYLSPVMDHSVIFVRQLAHLLWLLINEPANVDEQKAALRLLLTTSRQGAVSVALHGLDLQANGGMVPTAFTGVADLTMQMARHGLALISTEERATPADLLGVVRILASRPVEDDGGAAAEARRAALGITTIRFDVRPSFGHAPVPQPARETVALAAMEVEVPDDPLATAQRAPSESHDALLAQLESTVEAEDISRVLEDLEVSAESAARQGQARVLGEILHRIGMRETALPHFESRRAAAMTMKRIAKPEVLRLLARELPHDADRREQNLGVLSRAGVAGADALIEQITSVAQQRDRRIYFEALLNTRSGVPALLHMLGDTRWFVVCSAADLLGEMRVEEAEAPLSLLRQHEDDRVRRAGTGALMRLGTPRALQAIQQALTDPVAQTRMQAAAAFVTQKDVRTSVPQLLRALDVEKDDEVQAAFLSALGKLGTAEAVQRLVLTAEPKRGVFQRKATTVRVAAVNALADARTDEALAALRRLQDDRDEDVNAAVTQALGHMARATP